MLVCTVFEKIAVLTLFGTQNGKVGLKFSNILCNVKTNTTPRQWIISAQRNRSAKQKEQQQKRREWEDKQAAWKKWVETSPEQKVQGDLIIWKSRFKKENHRLPSIEEIKAKEQELIQALPSDEETQISIFGEVKYKDNTMDLFEDSKI